MTYIAPGPAAVNFDIGVGVHYIAPGPTAASFDLAAYGDTPIVYPPVPGVTTMVGTAWGRPAAKDRHLAAIFEQASQRDIQRQVAANQASRRPSPRIALPHQNAEIRNQSRASSWSTPAARERTLAAPSTQAPPKDIEQMGIRWESAGIRLGPALVSTFLVKTPWKDRTAVEHWRSSAVHAPTWRREESIPAPLALVQQGVAHITLDRQLRPYRPGHMSLGARFENNPIQPKDNYLVGPHGDAAKKDLHHSIPWGPAGRRDTTLEFVYPDYPGPIDLDPETITIPTLRFYIVANSAQIIRVSDGRDVPASAVTISADYQSYQWSMSAILAGRDAHALVEGTDAEPVEVDVQVNGLTWRLVVDGWSLQQAWRRNGGPIRGRSRTAYLAPPYNAPRDYRQISGGLAQQLAAQELPPGWTLDWGMPDWFVDGGAWHYQGLTPLDAIARIARAGGGYVQSHRTDDLVLTERLHKWAPWKLGEAIVDVQIPRAVMVERGSTKKAGSGVNGVIVHGGPIGGIAAHVGITGTGGNVLATTIVDDLTTDTIPARERGIAAISETLRQSRETHQLPLSSALGGLIAVGAIVEIGDDVGAGFVGDWRGVVRGVTVSAQAARGQSGGVALQVRQQLEIDRYFPDN